jgi:hypothetical protein
MKGEQRMGKKTLISVTVLCAVLLITLFAVKVHSQDDGGTLNVPSSFYNDVRAKLSQIIAQNDKMQIGVLQQKLDQIIASQEDIKQQLSILKTRIGATH